MFVWFIVFRGIFMIQTVCSAQIWEEKGSNTTQNTGCNIASTLTHTAHVCISKTHVRQRTSFQRSCGHNLKDNIYFCLLQICAVITSRGDFMQNQLKPLTLSLVNVKSNAAAAILFQWVLLHQVIR